MKFLFEEHAYGKEDLDFLTKEVQVKVCSVPGPDGIKICGVGYCYNFEKRESVFVLPKVLTEQETLMELQDDRLVHQEFLSQLSLWLYSAIAKYDRKRAGNSSVMRPACSYSSFDRKPLPTLIDVINNFKAYYRDNRNLFAFTAKNKLSGNNRIDWRRTMSKTPILQDSSENGERAVTPIYMELVNKKKVFDLDDRLIVLYFSAMNYIQETFGIAMPRSDFYKPLPVREMERLMSGGRGIRELRRIKYKYFADKFLKLYKIVRAFFAWGEGFASGGDSRQEYLLVSKFNNVFESMIDDLIGDENPDIQKMKNLDDGKIIDHLYKERSLVLAEDDATKIWHIGDSKYYREDRDVESKSIAKQFTYAKNLIQDFFSPDYFGSGDSEDSRSARSPHEGIRYRDKVTEGYNITPNFFIRGYAEPDALGNYDFDSDRLDVGESQNVSAENLWKLRNRQFENRLFDRDTLLLQVYDINFLFVLRAYTSKQSSVRDVFKEKAKKLFRENFIKLLDEHYYFWAVYLNGMDSYPSVDAYVGALVKFVDENFRALNGRIFQPAGITKCVILALEKESIGTGPDKKFEDYQRIRKIVEDRCEIFSITPTEIWNDEKLRKTPGWGV